MKILSAFKSLFTLGLFLLFSCPAFSASSTGVRTVYSSTNVGTTNWVVLVPALENTTTSFWVFDSSGQTLEIGACASGATANSEVRQFLIPPGGASVKVQIANGQRISIRAVSGSASAGENDLNVLF